ncbi:MAG: hypothetical protein PHY08_09835, partial [Candidatus Cloacimonetes bacterium]|nr:hypothetical protein [Candidatus Cloacimonadota bacterium]
MAKYTSTHTGEDVDEVVEVWSNNTDMSTLDNIDVTKKQALVYQNLNGSWKWAPKSLSADYYDKSEIDTALGQKINVGTGSGSLVLTDDNSYKDLNTVYYTKPETELLITEAKEELDEQKADKGTGDGTRYLSDDNVWRYLPTPLDGPVTGIRGETEQDFRTGNVVITKDNLGLTEELNEIHSDIDILIDEAITSVKETTLESEVLGFDNTGEGFLNDFNEKGKSVQDIEPNPNLFDISKFTINYDVDTQITNSDITVTATSLGTFRRVQSTNFILPAGTYYLHKDFEIISGTGAEATGRAILYEAGTVNNVKQDNGSFTLLNTTEVCLTLYLSTNSALVDLVSVRFYNIQIVQGSFTAETVPDWTPYGKPAALPHAPSPINSVPYEHNVVSCGKNLHDYEKSAAINDGSFVRITNGYRVTGNITTGAEFASSRGWFQSQATNGFANGITLLYLPIGEYTISADVKLIENRNTAKMKIYLRGLNDTDSIFTGNIHDLTVGQTVRISRTFNVEIANYYTPIFTINSNIVEITNVQVNLGAATDYQSYTGKTLPRSITDIAGNHYDLRSLPDGTADEVDWDNYLLHLYIGEKVLNGTESWIRQGNLDVNREHTFVMDMPLAAQPLNYTSGHTKSTHFKDVMYNDSYNNSGKDHCISLTEVVRRLYISSSAFNSFPVETAAANFKTWLAEQYNAGTPVTVIYKLATPQTIPLRKYGETYDGQVWDKNEPIPTQSGYTTIYTDAAVQPTLIAKEYLISQLGDIRVLKSADDKSFNPLTTTDAVYNRLTHKTLEEENAERDAEITNLNENKIDKKTTTGLYTYTHNGEIQGEIAISKAAGALDTIVQRDEGKIKGITPVVDDDVANKGYVDTQDALKQDKSPIDGKRYLLKDGQLQLFEEAINAVKESTFENSILDIPNTGEGFINSLETKFHTTGDEGTPDNSIPLVNVSEWNKTVCGRNLFDVGIESDYINSPTVDGDTVSGEISDGNAKYFVKKTYYPNKQMYISSVFTVAEKRYLIRLYDRNKVNISDTVSLSGWTYVAYYNGFVKDSDTTIDLTANANVAFIQIGFVLKTNGTNVNQTGIISDIMLTLGNTATDYNAFNGNTYPYRLEDVNGVLHEAGDLSDGTCDSVNWETGELIKRTKSIVLDGTEDSLYWIEADQLNDYLRFRISGFTDAVTDSSGNNGTLLCSHFINGPATNTLDLFECVSIRYDWQLFFKIAKSRLTGYSAELGDGTKAALLRTYLGEQYNAGTPVVVQYKLITPETYQLKKNFVEDGITYNKYPLPTLDGHTTIFTDKSITLMAKEYL